MRAKNKVALAVELSLFPNLSDLLEDVVMNMTLMFVLNVNS